MIQRIQSIFLLLTSVAFFLQFVFNLAVSDQAVASSLSDKIFNVFDNSILIGIAALGGVVALINIFLFRNRPLQIKLGYLLILLCIILPVVAAILLNVEDSSIFSTVSLTPGIGLFLPLVGLITTLLANRYINKDEKLVRSSDRLR